MNKEILVLENKILKLKHVFSKTIVIDENFSDKPFNIIIKEFDDYMKNNKIEGFGPIIVKSGFVGNEEKKMYIKLMRQTKNDTIKTIYPYEYAEEFKTIPCLFSRFNGNSNDQAIATMKMQVYAYEHNLVLDTESYAITKINDDESQIDTFIPILGRA